MKLSDFWEVVVANVLALVMIIIVQRVGKRKMFLGAFGIVIIVLPVAFNYFAGRLSLTEFLGPLLGIVLLAADLNGKLPSRFQVWQWIRR